METTNEYKAMRDKQQNEINLFPFFFAFSKEQFNKGMKGFDLSPDEIDKIYKFGDTGGFYKRTDAAQLREMFDKHKKEMQAAIDSDNTGEGFIFDMFFYELGNHEYVYTGDTTDALEALGLTESEVNANEKLKHGLKKAIKARKKSNCEA